MGKIKWSIQLSCRCHGFPKQKYIRPTCLIPKSKPYDVYILSFIVIPRIGWYVFLSLSLSPMKAMRITIHTFQTLQSLRLPKWSVHTHIRLYMGICACFLKGILKFAIKNAIACGGLYSLKCFYELNPIAAVCLFVYKSSSSTLWDPQPALSRWWGLCWRELDPYMHMHGMGRERHGWGLGEK